eukprot:scaffold8606_cov117-Isochrysis_galbana.AAC.3
MLRAHPVTCQTIVTPRRPRPGVTRRIGREEGGFKPGRHFEADEDEGRPRGCLAFDSLGATKRLGICAGLRKKEARDRNPGRIDLYRRLLSRPKASSGNGKGAIEPAAEKR